jgi:hypothetical protein
MASLVALTGGGDGGGWHEPPVDGDWLLSAARSAQSADCDWLVKLAQFDWQGGWMASGATSCVNWLHWHAQMARATAYEKLNVGHQLRLRPLLREAYGQGRVSYSAARLLARAKGATEEVELALLEVAESSGLSALERAIRYYELLSRDDQPEPSTLRSFRIRNNGDGTKTLSITVTDVEAEEFMAAVRLIIDHEDGAEAPPEATPALPAARARVSAAADGATEASCAAVASRLDTGVSPADEGDAGHHESAAADETDDFYDVPTNGCPPLDALMTMARMAFAHPDLANRAADDRYTVHLIKYPDAGPATIIDGTPITDAEFAQVACHAGRVVHEYSEVGEPLRLGRRQRLWSTAQRRAINVRDRGRCRFPGCDNRHVDIHHLRPWHAGGPTDIDNGANVCRRHHTMLHGEFSVEGDANGKLRFYRADGGLIGVS